MVIKSRPIIDKGREIAKVLWPSLEFVCEGDYWDKYGIDAHLDGKDIQIKFDRRIAISGNLYHEIYEKSDLRPQQPWRKAGGKVFAYIFTTENEEMFYGYLVTIDALANYENGQTLKAIWPNNGACTSLGFLIPLTRIQTEQRKKVKREL